MKLTKHILTVLGILIVAFGVNIIMPAQVRTQPVSASETSDKYDGDCTGHETAGRCADKCPADTDQGAYHLQGFDKETGAAVCGFTYFNACPYAEGYSATDPMCDKFAAQQQPATTPALTPPTNQCGGK